MWKPCSSTLDHDALCSPGWPRAVSLCVDVTYCSMSSAIISALLLLVCSLSGACCVGCGASLPRLSQVNVYLGNWQQVYTYFIKAENALEREVCGGRVRVSAHNVHVLMCSDGSYHRPIVAAPRPLFLYLFPLFQIPSLAFDPSLPPHPSPSFPPIYRTTEGGGQGLNPHQTQLCGRYVYMHPLTTPTLHSAL